MRYLLATCALLLSLGACSQGEDMAKETDATDVSAADAAPAAPSRDEDIRHFLAQEYPDAAPLKYALAWHDLDGDGADEAIVHLVTPYFCGTGGCNTLVLMSAGPMWRKVGEISVSRTPVSVLETSSNGWRDITVAVAGGGGPTGNAVLKFDGTAYPSNPTVAPAELTDATGTELLPEEPELVELAAEQNSAD